MAKQLIISDLTADFDQFVQDFETYLQNKDTWRGNLTTMTGQTLIELAASIGAFNQAKLSRAFTDAFPETSVSDAAIRAGTFMQGVRMTRRLPAQIQVQLTGTEGLVLPRFTQFECAGYQFFNRDAITLVGETPVEATLYQGEIVIYTMNGTGTNLQAWVSPETDFQISDQDVRVIINDKDIPVSYSGLWNYKATDACQDLTSSNGRLIIQFGTNNVAGLDQELADELGLGEPLAYGTVPGINDTVEIQYAVTEGESGNNYVTLNKSVTIDGYPDVEGKALDNPRYGASEKSTLVYKNNTSSAFGTYGSAVTKNQYLATVTTYPGVIDAITRAQREINPNDLELMNVIWVTGITNEPWDLAKRAEFCKWCQAQSMYSTRFVWKDATPVNRAVSVRVYCYNSAVLSDVEDNVKRAVLQLFQARSGILMLNIYRSDIYDTILASDKNIAYIILDEPTEDCVVTQPESPSLGFEVIEGSSTLAEQQYNYCVTLVDKLGNESTKNEWVHPLVTEANQQRVKLSWLPVTSAVQYKIYGRRGDSIGLMKTVNSDVHEFTDDGSVTPDQSQYEAYEDVEIKYNTLTSLNVDVSYADRQSRVDPTIGTR